MTPFSTRLTVDLGERSYPIEIGAGTLGGLGARMKRLGVGGRRVFVVSDTNVAPLYAAEATRSLQEAGYTATFMAIRAGEESKSLETLEGLYVFLLDGGVSRSNAIVALGGGVVGDLAGFAAATILRGIDFVQVPTTLVSMVDSSVGGKTGINHAKGKNLIGAFWQPRLVLADTDSLRTLPRGELVSGMGEVIKHGVIRDAAYFEFLEKDIDRILALEPEAIGRVVEGSCRIKAAVVAADERETAGVREHLNFGHTIGHALESVAGYGSFRHGEAVAIGMVAAGRLALRRALWPQADQDRLERLIERAGLPVRIPRALAQNSAALLQAMRIDKKVRDGALRFVLPERIGAVRIAGDITDKEVRSALEEAAA